jgi:hypothetical protein
VVFSDQHISLIMFFQDSSILCMYQYFGPFYDQKIFYCMDIPHLFLYSSIYGHLGCFLLWVILSMLHEHSCISFCVEKFFQFFTSTNTSTTTLTNNYLHLFYSLYYFSTMLTSTSTISIFIRLCYNQHNHLHHHCHNHHHHYLY